MILTDYQFLLDVHEITSQISLSFKQGDTGRVLYMTLTENGDIFNIPQNCVAVFTALKPDGTIIFNDCEINGNEIVYTHTAQTAAVTGKVDCELRLYGAGNTLITSPHFTIFVHPTVYFDQIESKDEVNTLTGLIYEASTLISSVNAKLDNGDFIPKMSIGKVETLPAGSAATASFTGDGNAPVLNLGIPMGEQGQAESLIPDTELSLESTRPVQNCVITEALNTKADAEAVSQALDTKADAEAVSQAFEEMSSDVETKVDKADGKGLSANDFTKEYKDKLDGIAEGANKYSLPVGGEAIGGVKSGGDISVTEDGEMQIEDGVVNRAKLANDALYSPIISASVAMTINNSHTGKTIRMVNGNGDFVIDVAKDANIPVGAEIAIMNNFSKSNIIVFGAGVKACWVGCGSNYATSPKLTIPEQFSMIALKKISSDASFDYWLVTGAAEVVT